MFIDELIPSLIHAAYRSFLVRFFSMHLAQVLHRMVDDASYFGIDVHPSHFDYLVKQAEGKYQ
jgi:hypothetical protein